MFLLSIRPTTENVFRECYNSFYLSRGGGVVIALASRSHMGTNRASAKDKPASGPLARRGSNPFPGAVFSSHF